MMAPCLGGHLLPWHQFHHCFSMKILLNTNGTGVWNAEGKNLKRYYEHKDPTIKKNY